MRVLYFGIYNPDYARNKVLIRGLEKNRVSVLECRASAKDRLWPVKLFIKYLKFIGKFDVMVVGFPGQEVMFLARLLTFRLIVFDAFTSHYGGYILDRKYFSPKSLRAAYYRFLDTWSCRLATLVLLDTQAHIDFFVQEFGLERDKFRHIWIGADDEAFYPLKCSEKKDFFTVVFWGTYIPLQGVKYILEAAEILKEENIRFKMIGSGSGLKEAQNFAGNHSLTNVVFYPMLRQSELIPQIACADVCLGIFGDTPKTNLVIPNKVYEAAAMRKPIITADTPAIQELFSRDSLVLVPAADSKAIASAILDIRNGGLQSEDRAGRSYAVFAGNANMAVLGKRLSECLSARFAIK